MIRDANNKELQVLHYIPDMQILLSKTDWYVPLIEIHPTDICNLNCTYCTFKNSQHRDVLPLSSIEKLKWFQPKGIVISGGGEPTLYNYKGASLDNFIEILHEQLPQTRIGLKTNGQIALRGNSLARLDRIRISINAGTAKTFHKTMGGSFEKCFDTLAYYINEGVPHVSVGYLFNDDNLCEIPDFLYRIQKLKNQVGDKFDGCVDIQFRPTCKIASCNCGSSNYTNSPIMVSDTTTHWTEQIAQLKDWLLSNPVSSGVLKCTNLNEENLFDYRANTAPFGNCYLSLIQMYIRANGDIYSCCQLASSQEGAIGNLLKDSVDAVRKNQQMFWNKSGGCKSTSYCCKLVSKKNVLLEEAVNNPGIGLKQLPYSIFI